MIFFRHIITLVFFLLGTNAIANENYPSLWDSEDPLLQDQLEAMVKEKGLWPYIENQTLSLVLVDITDSHQPRVAAVNGDVMLYAASLPKIAILLAAFVQIEQGKLELNQALMDDMTDMIRHSNNASATRVLARVGREDLLKIIKSFKFRLYDPEHGGGLWVGKDYAKKGAYQRDPIKNLSHAASAMQAARFYYLLETNRIVGPKLTKIMKEILSKPGISHKFVKGLKDIPDAKIYRKSGSWGEYHADSALVESYGHKFIIVGLAKHPNGGRWLSNLAAPLHDLIVKPLVANPTTNGKKK